MTERTSLSSRAPSDEGFRDRYPALETLTFSAKIDFVTVFTARRVELPDLDGTPKWPKEFHGQRLTVHDPSREDLLVLVDHLGPARVAELEVAVDVASLLDLGRDHREQELRSVMVNMFVARLNPSGKALTGTFRATVDRGRLLPFNLRLPSGDEQLLYGHRAEAAQVKAYLKRSDQGRALPPEAWTARVEVALRHEGLRAHGVEQLPHLLGFRYRKELAPYFRHVREVFRRELGRRTLRDSHRLLVQYHDERLKKAFDRTGIGVTKRGGKFADMPVRVRADSRVNDRIGQALLRLERSLREKFVCQS
ncbi:MAG: hypothetical protein HY854_12945 [Burkholderiales bacterium]|nr:hypothetical protein [Burkholderiales bacterium]